MINLYIRDKLNPQLINLNTNFTLGNCLFGSVKLTKNAESDKDKYSSYTIRFNSHTEFLFTDGSFGKNVFMFGADRTSSVHIDNKEKGSLILGEGATQGYQIDSRSKISY